MKALLLNIIFLTHIAVYAQVSPLLSVSQMQEDVYQLQQAIVKNYAGSYAGLEKAEMIELMADFRAQLHTPMSRQDFFHELSLLIAQSGERHFRIIPLWDLRTHVQPEHGYFPLSFKFVGRHAHILDKQAPLYQIERGSKILKINGQSLSSIITTLFPYIVSDGNIISSKYYDLAKNFAFYYYYYIKPAASFELILESQNGERYQVSIPATQQAPFASKSRVQRNVEASDLTYPKDKPYTFRLLPEHSSAILSLQTLNNAAFKEDENLYHAWLKARFQDIQQNQVNQLILDLRNNPGGRIDYLFELFSYLLPTQHPGAIKSQLTHDGRFDIFQFPSPKPEAFRGKIYVLINGGTFSAASELAGFLKAFTDCTILGIESAGSYQGFAAGTFYSLNLNHAQVLLKIPEHLYEFHLPTQSEAGRGVLPDIYIEQYIGDLLEGRDTQLNYALDFAKRAHQGLLENY